MLKNNPEIVAEKVEVCLNSMEEIDKSISPDERLERHRKCDILMDKKVFVYGGNWEKTQVIDFLFKCLQSPK